MNKHKSKNLVHGHTANKTKSKVYAAWITMKANCYDEYSASYHLYGEQGIQVCEEWRNDFPRFLADMGEPTNERMYLSLKEFSLGYTPENCYWGYKSERLYYQGEYKTIQEWAKEYGISKNTLQARLYRFGWPIKKALETPVDKRRCRKIYR